MTRTLRPYQERAVTETCGHLDQAHRVLVVAPPGAGKTTIGAEIVRRRDLVTLWVAHRLELVQQAFDRLTSEGLRCGMIVAGTCTDSFARIQVGTVQTLVNAPRRPAHVDLVVLDESHHHTADEWCEVHQAYPKAELVGLTATPRPGMADMFDELVVAATYSELVADGHLCPCPARNVLAPPPDAVDYEIACHPLKAWHQFGQDRQTLAYCSSVKQASAWSDEFQEDGIKAAVLHGKTPPITRRRILQDFEAGSLRVVWSVGILTEGVDLPCTACVLLARPCEDQSTFLQVTGRGLRPHPSKRDLVLIDLVGATLRHGYPTEDRVYSLTDAPIRRTSPEPLRQCPACGQTIAAYFRVCPNSECGEKYGPRGKRAPKIHDLELAAVYEAENTPHDAKRRALLRFVATAKARGYVLSWVTIQYKQLFGETPNLTEFAGDFIDENSDKALYKQLVITQVARGYKPNWANVQFRLRRGFWPSRQLQQLCGARPVSTLHSVGSRPRA
jgi:superfamily II DNA or RNA helicase